MCAGLTEQSDCGYRWRVEKRRRFSNLKATGILSPFSFPIGVNSGVYLYSHNTRTVTPVVVPGATPAPGGGMFAGASFGPSLNNRGDFFFGGIVPTDKGIQLRRTARKRKTWLKTTRRERGVAH
jgi:hypothetical protein